MIESGMIAKAFRYGIASLLALIVDVGLMWSLTTYAQVHYLAAAAIGFSTGCLVAYVVSKWFVFEDKSDRARWQTFLYFVVVGVAGLGINHVILYVGVDIMNLYLLVAKGLSAAVVFWFNFFLRGILVFKDPAVRRVQS